MEDPRFPIGKFDRSNLPADDAARRQCIDRIAALPELLQQAVAGLSGKQIDTPYREGGWTVRQVVHHLADANMNAYARFKLALTETNPTVRGYDENAWAVLPDSLVTPIDISLALLEHLHPRWVVLLRSMKTEDFDRTLQHSERGPMSLNLLLALYSWHGDHHTAHITSLRRRNQW